MTPIDAEDRMRPLFTTTALPSGERAVRVEFRLPVTFREKRRIRASAQGIVANVSETGLYIAIRHPPGIHDIVLMTLPGEPVDGRPEPIRLRGQVRWWRTARSRPDQALGFGVKILDYGDPSQRERYQGLVRRLQAGSPATP